MPTLITDIVRSDVVAMAPSTTKLADQSWFDILSYVNEVGRGASSGWPCGDIPASLGNPGDPTVRLARIYLAAHLATISLRGGLGAAGPVTGETAGGLRRTYGMLNLSKLTTAGFNTTLYGQAYLAIVESSAAHGPIVI